MVVKSEAVKATRQDCSSRVPVAVSVRVQHYHGATPTQLFKAPSKKDPLPQKREGVRGTKPIRTHNAAVGSEMLTVTRKS